MNKRRKVLITITYNEMGIIIDTKAEEVAQPNLQSTCNELATDCISRQAAIQTALDFIVEYLGGAFDEDFQKMLTERINALPSAKPDGIPLEWIDKHLEWLDNCDNDFAQLAKVGIRAMVEIWKKDKT